MSLSNIERFPIDVFRPIEKPDQSKRIAELEKENQFLRDQIKGMRGLTEEHFLYRKVLSEMKVDPALKGVWTP